MKKIKKHKACSSCRVIFRDENDLKPFRGECLCFDCYTAELEKVFNEKPKKNKV